jgi:ArsR family transcriptional regulator
MYEAGLLEKERRGTWIYYRLVSDRLEALRNALNVPEENFQSGKKEKFARV